MSSLLPKLRVIWFSWRNGVGQRSIIHTRRPSTPKQVGLTLWCKNTRVCITTKKMSLQSQFSHVKSSFHKYSLSLAVSWPNRLPPHVIERENSHKDFPSPRMIWMRMQNVKSWLCDGALFFQSQGEYFRTWTQNGAVMSYVKHALHTQLRLYFCAFFEWDFSRV